MAGADRMLMFLFILATCTTASFGGKLVKKWKTSEQTTELGHYPQPYCNLIHVVLNGTDGVFYYKSDTDLHSEACPLTNNVWDIQHVQELDNVECGEVYKTGYTFPIYYWYKTSNYFHLHYDTIIPLYKEVYYNEKRNRGRIAFLPAVESARLEKLSWDTDAFEEEGKFWLDISKFIAGKYDFLPLQRSLLKPGKNMCFKEVKFGTPRTDFGNKDFVRSFVRFVKSTMGIKEPRLEHEKLGIIARSNRRRIMNQLELVKELSPMIETELVFLENMSFKEQIQAMQNYSVLAGMNGAGLINCLYLPINSVCIQMVPYKAVVNVEQYKELLKTRGHYLEWHNRNPDLHKPVVGDANNNYPDTVVDVQEFTKIVEEAINMTRRMKPDYRDEL